MPEQNIHIPQEAPNLMLQVYNRGFDIDLLTSNIDLITGFLKTSSNLLERERNVIAARLQFIRNAYTSNWHILESLPNSPLVDNDLQSGLFRYNNTGVLKLHNHLSVTQEDIAPFSNSHAMLGEIVDQLPANNVGLVVFDAHGDFYQSRGLITPARKTQITNTKEGVLLRALQSGKVPAVAIWGIEENERTSITSGNNATNLYGYQPNQDRILIGNHFNLKKYNQFEAEATNLVLKMKGMDVDKLFFSLDVDVLTREYTAREYNVLSPLVNLSLVNLEHMLQVENVMETAYGIINVLNGFDYRINNNHVEVATTKRYGRPQYHGQTGMPLEYLLDGIDIVAEIAKYYGLEIGVRLNNKAKVLGDITELEGADYQGLTSYAANQLQDKLLSLS